MITIEAEENPDWWRGSLSESSVPIPTVLVSGRTLSYVELSLKPRSTPCVRKQTVRLDCSPATYVYLTVGRTFSEADPLFLEFVARRAPAHEQQQCTASSPTHQARVASSPLRPTSSSCESSSVLQNEIPIVEIRSDGLLTNS